MENPHYTFIFIGRSGCGKGTQAKLLIEALKKSVPAASTTPLLYIETGDKFRNFVAQTSHSSRLARRVMDRSERQPDFLAVWMWSHVLIENLMGDEHIVFDGTPRSLNEAKALDTAMGFYGREPIDVIYLDVSNDWSKVRMGERARHDDQKKGDMEKRLAWFETDVKPAVDYYQAEPTGYRFHQINGEQTIEEVHQAIVSSLSLPNLIPARVAEVPLP